MPIARTAAELGAHLAELGDFDMPLTRWEHSWHRVDADLRTAEVTEKQRDEFQEALLDLWRGRHS